MINTDKIMVMATARVLLLLLFIIQMIMKKSVFEIPKMVMP